MQQFTPQQSPPASLLFLYRQNLTNISSSGNGYTVLHPPTGLSNRNISPKTLTRTSNQNIQPEHPTGTSYQNIQPEHLTGISNRNIQPEHPTRTSSQNIQPEHPTRTSKRNIQPYGTISTPKISYETHTCKVLSPLCCDMHPSTSRRPPSLNSLVLSKSLPEMFRNRDKAVRHTTASRGKLTIAPLTSSSPPFSTICQCDRRRVR